jgi:hypothetical protein
MSDEDSKIIEFTPTYIHANTLIWQTPTLGIAIIAGTFASVKAISDINLNFGISKEIISGLFCLLSSILLLGFAFVLCRMMDYQVCSRNYRSNHVLDNHSRIFNLRLSGNSVIIFITLIEFGFLLFVGLSLIFGFSFLVAILVFSLSFLTSTLLISGRKKLRQEYAKVVAQKKMSENP